MSLTKYKIKDLIKVVTEKKITLDYKIFMALT